MKEVIIFVLLFTSPPYKKRFLSRGFFVLVFYMRLKKVLSQGSYNYYCGNQKISETMFHQISKTDRRLLGGSSQPVEQLGVPALNQNVDEEGKGDGAASRPEETVQTPDYLMKELDRRLFESKSKPEFIQNACGFIQKGNSEVAQHFESLLQTYDSLRQERIDLMNQIQRDSNIVYRLEQSSPVFKKDRDVMLAAVQRRWRALEHASLELKDDSEIVSAALFQTGPNSMDEDDDESFYRAKYSASWQAIKHAGETVRGDSELMLKAILHQSNNVQMLKYIDPGLRDNKDFMLNVLKGVNKDLEEIVYRYIDEKRITEWEDDIKQTLKNKLLAEGRKVR